jgi:hypothetical protein
MADEQPTDPRLPIIRRLAAALGLPLEAIGGTGDGHPPAIEVDLDPAGGRHQLVWRGGSGRTIAGMITVYSNGGVHGVRTEGADCSTWQPPITVGAPTIYEAVTDAAARLDELFDERMKNNTIPKYAVGSTIGPEGHTIGIGNPDHVVKDPFVGADDEHCRHGYPYPDCAVCHRTAGGAPNHDPGENGELEALRAEVERLGIELAQAHRELGEQRALADAMQAGIDQCPNTHDIDWPGDE